MKTDKSLKITVSGNNENLEKDLSVPIPVSNYKLNKLQVRTDKFYLKLSQEELRKIMTKKINKPNSVNSEISKMIWNQIGEFYKLRNQDERLEFIIKTRNKYYGK